MRLIKKPLFASQSELDMREAFVVVMYDRKNLGLFRLYANKDSMSQFGASELHCLSTPNEVHIKMVMTAFYIFCLISSVGNMLTIIHNNVEK